MDPKVIEKMQEWQNLVAEIEVFKDTRISRELELRKELTALLFPSPEEGTNNLPLENGWMLKLGYKLDRKIEDEEKLENVLVELQVRFSVDPKRIIRRRPEVALREYRTLTDEQRKVLDQALEIKPSTPTLELVPPKGQ